jgi:hypothetical protein
VNDPFSVMPEATARLFVRLQNTKLLRPFTLIGGTGLALHIAHRKSEDLDFITLQTRLPKPALQALECELKEEGHIVIRQIDSQTYDDFLNAGMDVGDHTQNFLIDGEVKLTFFTADSHHTNLLKDSPLQDTGFRIASLEELSQLKAVVATSRSKSRDWIDLFLLEQNYSFGLREWETAYNKAGLTKAHFENALNRICSGILREDDEGFDALLPNPPSIATIADHFRKLRMQYEISLAKKVLKS